MHDLITAIDGIASYRTLIYPLYMKGRPTPLYTVLLASMFCAFNGYMQGRWLTHFQEYDESWLYHPVFIGGAALFLLGQAISIHSDMVLQGLCKPGETETTTIPHGIAVLLNCVFILFLTCFMQVDFLNTSLLRTTLGRLWNGWATRWRLYHCLQWHLQYSLVSTLEAML